MERKELIEKTAKLYLKRRGLSESIICGKTSNGREINQLEHAELELGTESNYRIKQLYDECKKLAN